MDGLYKELGRRLRRARELSHLTQDALAERVSLSRTSIANIEQGRQRIQIHTLYALAVALRVSPRSLLPPESPVLSDELKQSLGSLQPMEIEWVKMVLQGGEPTGDDTE